MGNYIEQQIRDRERRLSDLRVKLAELRQQRVVLEAQLEAYRDVLEHSEGTRTAASRPSKDMAADAGQEQRRQLSGKWIKVLLHLAASYPNALSLDAMLTWARHQSLEITRQNLRSQLSIYTDRGYTERVRAGLYRITRAGAEAVGAELETGGGRDAPKENEPPTREGGGSDTGEASPSPERQPSGSQSAHTGE